MKNEIKLIDEIISEISTRNLLNEITHICITEPGLEKLKEEYYDEFEIELRDSGRQASLKDLEDYFGKPIVVSTIENEGKEYHLLAKV